MGQGRPGRKKTVVLSSDDEDEQPLAEDIVSDHDPPAKNNGKLKTVSERASGSQAKAAVSTKPKVASSTAQTHASKRPSKPAAEPEQKQGNKPIFSFFNAATQRQQPSSQDSNNSPPRGSGTSTELLEDIQDDISGDDSSITLARSSQTAQALRKRKLQNNQIADLADRGAPSASQKFRKLSDGTRVPAKITGNVQDTRPWVERFAPVDLSELAVHKRKVTDVHNVLESALSERARPRLIVMKGAAGTAKTTTVNLLAKDMGVEVVEWKSPVGSDISSTTFASASSQFDDFVLRSGKFAGLELVSGDGILQQTTTIVGKIENVSNRRQIMLVEEFPNTFTKSSPALQAFRSTIQQFLAVPTSAFSKPTPLVMIISEALLSTSTASADSFTAHRLLGPQILNHPQTAQIEFNNIAPTYLTKALETIVVKEARKSGRRTTPGPAVLKRLAETGDIRSAVSALEFLCLYGDDGGAWSAKVAFTKPKSGRAEAPLSKKEQEALKLVSNRESSLGIFHAVGRVVYNKRVDPSSPAPQPPTYFPQHRKPKVPENSPDTLIDEIGTDTSTFIAALQENYALSCSSSSSEDALDSLNGCIDALSDSDMLSFDRFGLGNRAYSGSAQDNLRQDEMSFQTAVRGLLFWLPSPVNRIAGLPRGAKRGDEFRMFYPSTLKLWKQREEIEGTLESVTALMQAQALDTKSSAASGVAAWQRHQSSGVEQEEENANSTILPLSTALLTATAKSETLLDRLPYAAQILPRRQHTPQALLTGINKLTHISGTGTAATSLDEDADADDIEADIPQAEWTDRPDEGKGVRRDMKRDKSGNQTVMKTVEDVEKLVLSDDDIEDFD